MSHRRGFLRLAGATAAAFSTLVLGMGVASGAAAAPSHISKLISPAQKYYGVYVSQAPASMAPIQKVTQETGKAPNMSLFYNAWNSGATTGYANISTTAITNACAAGMLPMLTWESWNTATTDSHGVAWAQPDFAPSVIAGGRYDTYIRAVAEQLKTVGCPVALRLDQEVNSYWYPWGINTVGMTNSAADYVAMWQHVWTIFNQVGASNVIWVWSPNVQSAKHTGLPDLSASYPGDSYVDWVGVDGYLGSTANDTFKSRFQPTFDQLRSFVPDKPWIIAECGVSTGADKPAQLTDVLSAVARRSRIVGINYFDTNKSTGNYLIDETSSSLEAFKTAINNPAFGTATPGETPGS